MKCEVCEEEIETGEEVDVIGPEGGSIVVHKEICCGINEKSVKMIGKAKMILPITLITGMIMFGLFGRIVGVTSLVLMGCVGVVIIELMRKRIKKLENQLLGEKATERKKNE